MAVWAKENCVIKLVASSTLANEANTHIVQFQPVDQAFSAGAVSGLQGTGNGALYYAAEDLDSTMCYAVHIDSATTPIHTICGPDTIRVLAE